MKCPDCNGQGGEAFVDIVDYVECPLCEGSGKVEEGTKGWVQNLFEARV